MKRISSNVIAARCRAFAVERGGNVTIEMAFLSIFLLTLVLAAYDFGRLALNQAGVTQAARAGAQYAVLDQANAADVAGMQQAARDEADDPSLNVTARNFCRCPGTTVEVGCNTDCADGEYAPLFVEVTVQDQMQLLFNYPYVPKTQDMSSISTVRVR